MKVLTMSWDTKEERNVGVAHVLVKNGIELISIGNYYDSKHIFVLGTEYPLSFLFNCEKRFRLVENGKEYVESILEKWLSTCFFETNKITKEDWGVLKERVETPIFGVMDLGHYEDVKKALGIPLKKIPIAMQVGGKITNEVYRFRLERGF